MVTKVLALIAIVLTGCASGGVGPRLGADIPLSGFGASGDVSSTSSQIGFVGGVTFEGLFNKTWGFRADPQIRSIGGSANFSGSATNESGVFTNTGVMTTDVTFIDLPIMATFSPTDSGASIHPFLCFGAMLSASSSVSTSASGTQTYTEGGQSVSAPLSLQDNNSYIGGPFVSILFAGGVRMPISSSWEWRVEARLQQLVTDADIASYTSYTDSFREVASVTMSAPTTSLGITLGLLLKL